MLEQPKLVGEKSFHEKNVEEMIESDPPKIDQQPTKSTTERKVLNNNVSPLFVFIFKNKKSQTKILNIIKNQQNNRWSCDFLLCHFNRNCFLQQIHLQWINIFFQFPTGCDMVPTCNCTFVHCSHISNDNHIKKSIFERIWLSIKKKERITCSIFQLPPRIGIWSSSRETNLAIDRCLLVNAHFQQLYPRHSQCRLLPNRKVFLSFSSTTKSPLNLTFKKQDLYQSFGVLFSNITSWE